MKILVESSTKKRDPRQYRWYVYTGRKARFNTEDPEFDFTLSKGEKFGVKKARNSYFLIDGEDRTIQFKLSKMDITRILNNSKGWSGRIGRVTVRSGEESTSDKKRGTHEGYVDMRVDSSMLRKAAYNSKKKNLIIMFPNGAEWVYHDVSAREAMTLERSPSQGKYFNRVIKGVKDSQRIEKS